MIYIDPPYNTGSDFVYNDDFKQSTDEYLEDSGQFDEDGNRLEKNLESNGRFHTDWLNMIYPRLKLARNLLSDDGVIFISIDDNEQANLKKVCDEIFGESNFICKFVWRKTSNPNKTSDNIGVEHEYILVYSKTKNYMLNLLPFEDIDIKKYNGKDEFYGTRGPFKLVGLNKTGTTNDLRPNLMYEIDAPDGTKILPKPRWRWSKDKFEEGLKENRIVFNKTNNKWTVSYKQYLNEDNNGQIIKRGNLIKTIFDQDGRTTDGTNEIKKLFEKGYFDFPKPSKLIKKIVYLASNKDSLIFDFFSGSATTADAVMQLNAEDGGNRKFIMVQLPEETDEKSEAYKAGYKNICEIGKERIRRAGKKILEDNKDKEGIENLDIGFRVLKTDTSNMKDVYYKPGELNQNFLDTLTDNIKEDRTGEDLLFQVMLDLGIPLSSKIETEDIDGKEIFIVDDGYLIASFDRDIDDSIVTKIANREPAFAVFRDSSMKSDSALNNFDQIFERLSPETTRRVI